MVGLHVDDGSRGPSIRTASGGRFYLCDPDPAELDVEVIAHSLSKLCRYTGHTSSHYSVAQHCVVVSRIVPRDLAMAGLMHDASEAYIGDISRPLKIVLEDLAPGIVPGIENAIHAAVAERFGFLYPHDPLVKDADNVALATELPAPLEGRLYPWSDTIAESAFIRRFQELGGK
jgi:hypothetical protein